MNKKINRFLFPLIFIVTINLITIGVAASPSFEDLPEMLIGAGVITFFSGIFYCVFTLISKAFIRNDLAAIFTCLAGSYLCVYKIFRIMHWPGTLLFLMLGGIFVIAALIFLLLSRSKDQY